VNTINTANALNFSAGIAGLPSAVPGSAASARGLAAGGFGETLLDSLRQVNNLQQDADRAVEALFTGEAANPAEVLTAVQKADLAFRTMMQIRNKLVAAYDELKNIRV
jgi:flagellar hook-basal body complex protein FliE